ncbi:hypothetical protein [Bacillus cihuensis]|uniref:hypothetical protein n=1 Tax=Bacillus cihuensis TaxID=1208599 RepID=UPI00048CF4CC|nr:hypothetical protein [Bacillus cihuensis]
MEKVKKLVYRQYVQYPEYQSEPLWDPNQLWYHNHQLLPYQQIYHPQLWNQGQNIQHKIWHSPGHKHTKKLPLHPYINGYLIMGG